MHGTDWGFLPWLQLRTVLQEDGTGRVLVVDNGASMRCACLGDVLATLAHKSGGYMLNRGCAEQRRSRTVVSAGKKIRSTLMPYLLHPWLQAGLASSSTAASVTLLKWRGELAALEGRQHCDGPCRDVAGTA